MCVVAWAILRLFILFIWVSPSLIQVQAIDVLDAVRSRIVRRPHFGVSFQFQQHIYTYSEEYSHHLVFSLPQNITEMNKKLAQYTVFHNFTKAYNQTYTYYDGFVRALNLQMSHIKQITQNIYDLIPAIDVKMLSKRKNRGLLNILGDIRKLIEGTATEADVQAVTGVLDKSNNLTERHFLSIERSISALGSFSRVNNEKIESLKTLVSYLRRIGANTVASLQTVTVEMKHLPHLLGVVLNSIGDSVDLLLLHHAILSLSQGHLTPDLLPLNQADKILSQIKDHVHEKSLLYLADDSALSVYRDTDFSYFRTDSQIHIILKIKLSPFQSPLALFRVNVFPLKVPDQNHSTTIQQLPAYMALNDNDQMYLIFDQYPKLKKEKFYHIDSSQHSIHSTTQKSCIMSLFHDNVKDITSLCQTYLRPFLIQPVLMSLGNNLVLMQNINKYSLVNKYNQTTKFNQSCVSCIVSVPCNHKIETPHGILFTPATQCEQARSNNETVLEGHLANLHLLSAFLSDELINKLSSDFSLKNPLNWTLPALEVYRPDEEAAIAKADRILDSPQIDIQKVINDTMRDSIIFKSESDRLSYEIKQITTRDWSSSFNFSSLTSWIKNPFAIGTNFILILLIVGLAFIYYKVYALSMAILMLQRLVPTQSLTLEEELHNFLNQRQTTLSTVTPLVYRPQVSQEYHILDVIIIILFIAFWLYLAWKVFKARQNCHTVTVYLEIGNQHTRIKIPVLYLPHENTHYKFTASKFISNIYMVGFRKPRLHIVWPSFKVEHVLIPLQYDLPECHSLNYVQAVKLKRILQSDFSVLMWTRSYGSPHYQIVELQNSTWAQLQTARPKRLMTGHRSLYPLLQPNLEATEFV